MKKEVTYLYGLTILYFIVSLAGIFHHELWLDEAHHWLIARESNSIADLINKTKYEGHPLLWSFILYGITRFTSNPFWMQFIHILISTTAVFIFLRKAPFRWLFKVLFIFGYFMLFEYNLISRSYILGVFFLFAACSVFEKRDKNFIQLSFYLAMAANTHLMFAMIACALYCIPLTAHFKKSRLFGNKQYNVGYLIFSFGLILVLLRILSTDSTWFFAGLHDIPLTEKFTKGFISFFKGLFVIPDFRTIHFWNSNLLVNLSKTMSGLLGLLVYLLPVVLFYKNRKILFFVYSALLFTQFFFFVTQRGATRFDGVTYFIIIIGLWIQNNFKDSIINSTSQRLNLIQNISIYCILSIQFFSGVTAYALDYAYPFTASEDTAAFLKRIKINPAEIITFSCDGTALCPYIDNNIWFLSEKSPQSYCHWNIAYQTKFSNQIVADLLSDYMDHHKHAVYISRTTFINSPLNVWTVINAKFKTRLIKTFNHNIIQNSDYYVFEVESLNPDL